MHIAAFLLFALSFVFIPASSLLCNPPEKGRLLREHYAPYTIGYKAGLARQEFDLSGNWLFIPGKHDESAANPAGPDADWHVMDVPNFWQPRGWWVTRTYSRKYTDAENARVKERYTFDAAATKQGWYRHWITVPEAMKGKRISVAFDGAAMLADVFWNGQKVGGHVGMFGRFECEVTPHVRWGKKNLLAVRLSIDSTDTDEVDEVVGVAVTLQITKSMLNRLPHGGFGTHMGNSKPFAYGGLWQPVRLVVTGPVKADKVFFTPTLDSAEIETTLSGEGRQVVLEESLTPKGGKKAIWSHRQKLKLSGDPTTVTTKTSKLKPKLWSPEHPDLYILKTRVLVNGVVTDEKLTQVGFRTFEVKGDRFYLNGKPYWLRGASMPPYGYAPNDGAVAHRFFRFMHEGNQMVTRACIAPYNEKWATAADEEGVAVFDEGIWPWALMTKLPPPRQELLDHWLKEQLEVIRDLKNHPSIVLRTLGNELIQGDYNNVEKWKIVSGMIKAIRKEDPTRPVILSSEATRHHYADLWKNTLAPGGYDDGDADDTHCYYGWYYPSAMMMDFTKPFPGFRFSPTEGRAFITQEGGTGYPSVDDGFPDTPYHDVFKVPQTWVGQYALRECGSPEIFQRSLAELSKEIAEKTRRQRKYWAGYMLFANLCWYKNSYDARTMEPFPVHEAVRMAYSPVLVSLDTTQRHCFAGKNFKSRICIVNDDIDMPVARSLTLSCWVEDASGKRLTDNVSKTVEDCPYYNQVWDDISLRMPEVEARSDVVLCLELGSGGKRISINRYDLVVCSRKWSGHTSPDTGEVIVLKGECSKEEFDRAATASSQGATVLWLEAGTTAAEYLPDAVESVMAYSGEFVDMNDKNSPLFDGFEPLDLRWWYSPGIAPSVTEIQFRLKEDGPARSFTTYIRPHLYGTADSLRKLPHSTVFEMPYGSGWIIVSSMRTGAAETDPLAARFLSNLHAYASSR